MQNRFAHALAVIMLIGFLSLSHSHANSESEMRLPLAGSPYDLVAAVNTLRASYGLAPYRTSSILMITAQNHADYMAATGRVSHTGSGGSSVTDRLLAAGYPLAGDLSLGGFRSENITSGVEGMSAQAAVDQWTGDTLHLTTMISPNLTEIGAGVTVNAGRVYYVIDCAQPTNGGLAPDAVTSAAVLTTVPGAVIIPVVVSTPNEAGDLIHEVKAGQTLWEIAISYDAKIDEIKRLNNLSGDDIYPGMTLLVKQGVTVSPTTAFTAPASPALVTSAVVLSATPLASTRTPVAVATVSTTSNRSIRTYVIGIVVLALLGGGLFVWLGTIKNE